VIGKPRALLQVKDETTYLAVVDFAGIGWQSLIIQVIGQQFNYRRGVRYRLLAVSFCPGTESVELQKIIKLRWRLLAQHFL
jgi:hypothetical protein